MCTPSCAPDSRSLQSPMNAKFTESRALSTPRQTCRDSHAATCATGLYLECTRTEELGDGLLGGTEFLVMDKCIVDVVLIFSSCSVVFVVESYALLCQVRSLIMSVSPSASFRTAHKPSVTLVGSAPTACISDQGLCWCLWRMQGSCSHRCCFLDCAFR